MKKTLTIEGMTCGHCVNHTTEALKGVAGVTAVNVDLDSKSAVIETNGEVSEATLKEAVSEAGYTVTSVN